LVKDPVCHGTPIPPLEVEIGTRGSDEGADEDEGVGTDGLR
jgi:hypothetical protein